MLGQPILRDQVMWVHKFIHYTTGIFYIMISLAKLIPTPAPLGSLDGEIVTSLCLAYSACALNIERVMPYTVIYVGKH